MRVLIEQPEQRSLTVQERKVWDLLIQGKTPEEIAQITKIPFGYYTNWTDNSHNVAFTTVKSIICSIHEKGWDENNKEGGYKMAKLNEIQKREIITKRQAGASLPALGREYKVSPTAISDVCKRYDKLGEAMFNAPQTENEPETAATVPSSEETIESFDNVSDSIVPDIEPNVKPEEEIEDETMEELQRTPAVPVAPVIPEAVIEAVNRYRDELRKDISYHEAYIADLKEQLGELNGFIELARMCNPVEGI